MWGARKELRVCCRVPYSQRTPYSYGYAYTNASATTVPSTVMRRPYPLLYPGTGHGSRSRGDAVHCEKEPLTQGTLVRGRAQGPGAGQAAKGSPKAQNITGKLYSIALSLSVTRSACHRCAFCGQYGGAEACTDCDRAQRAPAHQTTPVARRVALPGIPRPTPRAAHALRYSRGGWPS